MATFCWGRVLTEKENKEPLGGRNEISLASGWCLHRLGTFIKGLYLHLNKYNIQIPLVVQGADSMLLKKPCKPDSRNCGIPHAVTNNQIQPNIFGN